MLAATSVKPAPAVDASSVKSTAMEFMAGTAEILMVPRTAPVLFPGMIDNDVRLVAQVVAHSPGVRRIAVVRVAVPVAVIRSATKKATANHDGRDD